MSLQLTTVVPSSILLSPPNYSLYSFKSCSNARKRTVEGPNIGCFSTPIPKACLAAASDFAEADEEKSAVGEMMPKHVAIIMDGNGRWAKNRKLPVHEGHRAGSQTLTALVSKCCELGIKTLTTFNFSKENWKRSKMEVDFLMIAFENYVRSDLKELIARCNIRFSMIGNKSRLSKSLESSISWAEKTSKANKGMHFVIALNYSGRDDVVEAAKKIATKAERGILRPNDIDETVFEKELMTNILEFPNPDLLIRTSGEHRISNFLLWQSAYTEFYFADKLFPDFGEDDLREALASYQCRHRRFGSKHE